MKSKKFSNGIWNINTKILGLKIDVGDQTIGKNTLEL